MIFVGVYFVFTKTQISQKKLAKIFKHQLRSFANASCSRRRPDWRSRMCFLHAPVKYLLLVRLPVSLIASGYLVSQILISSPSIVRFFPFFSDYLFKLPCMHACMHLDIGATYVCTHVLSSANRPPTQLVVRKFNWQWFFWLAGYYSLQKELLVL